MIFQALVRHHQTGAIPVQQLQTIRAFGAKHKYRAREWVLIQFVLDPCGKSIMVRRDNQDERVASIKVRVAGSS